MSATLRWRMATPFGQPGRPRGVEDVGEVLAAHLDLEGGRRRPSRGDGPTTTAVRRRCRRRRGRGADDDVLQRGEGAGHRAGGGASSASVSMARTSACPRRRSSSTSVRRVLVGHRHRTRLVHRRVGHHEAQRLLGAQVDRHPVALGDTQADQRTRQAVGLGLPLGEGHLHRRRRPGRRPGRGRPPPWRAGGR